MSYNRDQFAEGVGRRLAPGFLGWVSDQFYDHQGAKTSALLALAFLVISVGWHFSCRSPEIALQHGERLHTIYEHFVLDMGDLEAKRYHVLVTHAFMYNDLLHSILMALPILYFATFVERRIGSWITFLIFFAGVGIGGICQISVGDPETFQNIQQALTAMGTEYDILNSSIQQVNRWLADLHAYSSQINSFEGPAAGVAALMTFCVLVQIFHHPGQLPFLGLVTAAWVTVDWFGFFHFEMSVGLTARIAGCLVGFVLAVLFLLVTIPKTLRQRVNTAWRYDG